MIKKVISGGQTGADQGGLLGANKSRGVETGGWISKGFLTEHGSDPSLSRFGLRETKSEKYRVRTIRNAKRSDGTLWVGNSDSPGARLTLGTCERYGKASIEIPFRREKDQPRPEFYVPDVVEWVKENEIEVLNVAGNRESRNCGITCFTETLVMLVIRELKHPGALEQAENAPKKQPRRQRKNRIKRERVKVRR